MPTLVFRPLLRRADGGFSGSCRRLLLGAVGLGRPVLATAIPPLAWRDPPLIRTCHDPEPIPEGVFA